MAALTCLQFELYHLLDDRVDNVIIGITHLPYCLDIKIACIDGSVQSRDRYSSCV